VRESSSTIVVQAAERLAAVLEAENAALVALDVAGAAALLEEKLAAANALVQATAGRPVARQTPEAAGLALRVRDLADRNRSLLEHAIAVQARVLDLVAQAARQHAAQAGGSYTSGGAAPSSRHGPDRGAAALHLRA